MKAGLLGAFVHHCHRRHGFVDQRWQGRFKSPVVQCQAFFLSCGGYVERFPLEAGLVAQPWYHEWSSERAHGTGTADPMLTESAEYQELASDAKEQGLWRRFLLGDHPREQAVRRVDRVIGDDAFRLNASQAQGRPATRGRGSPRKPSTPQ